MRLMRNLRGLFVFALVPLNYSRFRINLVISHIVQHTCIQSPIQQPIVILHGSLTNSVMYDSFTIREIETYIPNKLNLTWKYHYKSMDFKHILKYSQTTDKTLNNNNSKKKKN